MALEGVYTKEFVYEEFKKLKTNKEKVKYLIDLKQLKIDHPKIFSMKITLKQIENLIREGNSPKPFAKALNPNHKTASKNINFFISLSSSLIHVVFLFLLSL